MKIKHVLSLTKAWRYSQKKFFTFCKYWRVLRVELYAIKILFVSSCEMLLEICLQFMEPFYRFIMFWKKIIRLWFKLFFFKENAEIITYNKHFLILVLLNMNEQYFYFMLAELWEFYQYLRFIFCFNLPAPCAVHL